MADAPFSINLPLGTAQPVGMLPRVPASPAAPAAPAARPVAPTPIPDGRNVPGTIPPDVLQIGGQLYGQGVRVGEIRELARGMTIEDAMKLTAGKNGVDEIYFTDEDNRSYVLFAEKTEFKDVAKGYLGRYNGKRIRVVEVDDENNTFKQGVKSTWVWLHSALTNSFGTEAGKSINGLVSTAIGSFVAAAALKGSVPSLMTTTPAAGGTVIAVAEGLVKGVSGAMKNAVTGFVQTMASIVLFGVGAVGVISIVSGVRGHYAKGDLTAVDMVTGRF